jgi:tetratricopeptide (TPR) repeat protein
MSASDDLHSRILSHGPSSDTLFILLSRMKKEGELRKVIQACVRALDMYPSDIPIRKLLAEAFLDAGFLSQAEEEMQKVTRQITELATIYKRKAEVLAKQQRSREALEAAQTYLAHYPDDQDALRLLEVVSPAEEDAGEETPEEAEEAPVESMPKEPGSVPETSPGDEASGEMLQEPQDMTADEAPTELVAGDAEEAGAGAKERTEKAISTLESWLEDIREIAKPIS